MKKTNLKNDTMNESDFQKIFNFSLYTKTLQFTQIEYLLK